MKLFKKLPALGLVAMAVASCQIFENQTPETISFRMDGPAGAVVSVIYSKQFVAGVDETGVTQVQIFGADTVQHVLPIDTIIDVRLERRMFIRAETATTDTLDVIVRVDVNDRSLYDNSGKLYPDIDWKFLYQFNTPFTDNIQIVI